LSAAVGPVDAEKIKKMPPMWGVSSVRWYFDCGDEDFGSKGNALMHIALCDKKIPHEYRVRDGAHNWTYWRTALPEVYYRIVPSKLRFLA
jgi:S-formylglutathione hydrolase FrmB